MLKLFSAGGPDQVPLPALRRPRQHPSAGQRRREGQEEDASAGQQPGPQPQRLPHPPRERPREGARRRLQTHPQDSPGTVEKGPSSAQESRTTGML